VSVGDITSDARGSGARFNDGKVPYELVPVRVIADVMNHRAAECALRLNAGEQRDALRLQRVSDVLASLGEWQCGGDGDDLLDAIAATRALEGVEPHRALESAARVFDYGRNKYAEWNWSKGMPWSVPLACAVRHLLAIAGGEDTDPESGLPHAGHVQCNLVMLLTFARTFPEGDDRPGALRAP
jgi:hypothetical protein